MSAGKAVLETIPTRLEEEIEKNEKKKRGYG